MRPLKNGLFLDLDQISADFEIEHFSKVSIMLHISGNVFSMKNQVIVHGFKGSGVQTLYPHYHTSFCKRF